jgi:hypothetical protein
MFSEFPLYLATIDAIATVSSTLTGTITTTSNSKIVTGTGTNFIIEAPVGSQLFVTISDVKTSLGYVGVVNSNTELLLEESASNVVASATSTVEVYRSGYTVNDNGFLQETNSDAKAIVDFFRRVNVVEKYTKNVSVLVPYTVEDEETPELVSQKFYGTPFYHWVLLMLNNITNPYEQWPLTESELREKIAFKYPGESKDDTYEYRNVETDYVEDYSAAAVLAGTQYEVTIYDYEQELNEAKRNIKVLNPAFIDEFIKEFYSALNKEV